MPLSHAPYLPDVGRARDVGVQAAHVKGPRRAEQREVLEQRRAGLLAAVPVLEYAGPRVSRSCRAFPKLVRFTPRLSMQWAWGSGKAGYASKL